VVERVDRRPKLKARFGEYFFTYAALASFNRKYLVRPPRLRVEVAGRSLEGVTVIVQNADPFTYFGSRPIRICEGAAIDDGTLSLAVLKRATPLEMPTLIPRVFAARASAVLGHRQVEGFSDETRFRVERAGDRMLPVEVDGDYVGEFDEVEYGIAPRSLAVVS
jgi:diacylglycerol kinase family enzyme